MNAASHPRLKTLVSGVLGAGICASAWGGAATAPAGPGAPLPKAFPEARYDQMRQRSPFVVASAAAPTAVAAPGFAAQLYVDGIAHVGGVDFVAIKSRDPDKPSAILVQVGTTTDDGIKVDSIQWAAEMGHSTVAVTKGNERATLNFDEAQIAKTGAAAATVAINTQAIAFAPGNSGPGKVRVMPGYVPRPGVPVPKIYQVHDD